MRSKTSHKSNYKAMMGVTTVGLLLLTACGNGDEQEGSSSEFGLLVHQEGPDIPDTLNALAEEQCESENEALPLSVETVPQSNLDQQLQLLAGQDGLPEQFAAGNAPALTQELADAGHVLDLEEAFEDLEILETVEPAVLSTIESLYGGFNVLPYEYNIEGIWYNREIFDDNDLEVPETWEELVRTADVLSDANVTPFSASGEQGWPLTRFISNYLFRTIGPDAMERVDDGEASLTDPEYVEAAAAVAELGEAGHFGQGVGSIDMDTSTSEFLNGNAAMYYMGSWALSDFNDEEQNRIGNDAIGFMPFPNVGEGTDSRHEIVAHVGLPLSINVQSYDDDVADWLKCINDNFGTVAMEQSNRITGFPVDDSVETDPMVDMVQEQIESTDETVLWFEAFFSTAATTTSQQNAAQLINGSITPEEFMELIQSDL